MSRRSEERRRLNEEFDDDYDINISRILKRSSKNPDKLKEAKRGRSKNYDKRKQGKFIFRRG